MRRLPADACIRCSFSRRQSEDLPASLCLECLARPEDPLDLIRAWGSYAGALESAIHALKYQGHHFLGGPLAELLFEAWCLDFSSGADLVVPVPLHPSRLRRRGYNQAELLSRDFGRRAGIATDAGLLRKMRNTPPQATRNRAERLTGLTRVFLARPEVRGADVLLVDDVCTTGATLRSCAAALRKGGAASVRALVLARA
ncbi:MAG: ComF family protein [Thermoanaerobaculia bacterium]